MIHNGSLNQSIKVILSVCLVCSLLVSTAAVMLHDRQKENQRQERIKNILNSYLLVVGTEEENRTLLEKISRLEQEKNELIEAKLENERLKKILKLKSEKRAFVTAARVFARDPTNWFQTLWIDKAD